MGDRAATGGYDPSGIDIEAWEKLELQLEETIPNYDRVNRLMTFGQDKRWRRNVRNHATVGMKEGWFARLLKLLQAQPVCDAQAGERWREHRSNSAFDSVVI